MNDMDKADAAMETVKQLIRKHFGCDADEIEKKPNATNNSVYCFTVGGGSFLSETVQKQRLAGSRKDSLCLSKAVTEQPSLLRAHCIQPG